MPLLPTRMHGCSAAPVLFALVTLGSALVCYECDERVRNVDTCQQPTRQNCTAADSIGAQANAVCVQMLQRFSTGQPSWVRANCGLSAMFDTFQLNTCITSSLAGAGAANQTGDTLTTCTCDTQDLCIANNTAAGLRRRPLTAGGAGALLPLLCALLAVLIASAPAGGPPRAR